MSAILSMYDQILVRVNCKTCGPSEVKVGQLIGKTAFACATCGKELPLDQEPLRSHLAMLVENGDVITLVSEEDGAVNGFLIASLQNPPPVYKPGGKTCVIDDFTVADDTLWQDAGRGLLREALTQAAAKGAAQSVVISPDAYTAKKKLLESEGLLLTSGWWTVPLLDRQ